MRVEGAGAERAEPRSGGVDTGEWVVPAGQGGEQPGERQGVDHKPLVARQRGEVFRVVPRAGGGGDRARQGVLGAGDLRGGIEPPGQIPGPQRQVVGVHPGVLRRQPAGGLAQGEPGDAARGAPGPARFPPGRRGGPERPGRRRAGRAGFLRCPAPGGARARRRRRGTAGHGSRPAGRPRRGAAGGLVGVVRPGLAEQTRPQAACGAASGWASGSGSSSQRTRSASAMAFPQSVDSPWRSSRGEPIRGQRIRHKGDFRPALARAAPPRRAGASIPSAKLYFADVAGFDMTPHGRI